MKRGRVIVYYKKGNTGIFSKCCILEMKDEAEFYLVLDVIFIQVKAMTQA